MDWSAFSDPDLASEARNVSVDKNSSLAEQIHQTYSFICSILMLTLCCIGAMGNLLSISIFTRRSMRSSINVLLSGLSTVDLSVLLGAIIVFVVPGLNAYGHFGPLQTLQILIIFGFYQAGMIAQTCSVWTFVLISVERYLAVCHPLDVHRFLTVRRAKCAQLFVFAFSLCYNSIRFCEYSLVYENNSNSSRHWWPNGYKRWLRDQHWYFVWYYTASYILVHFVIPFPLITVLNIHILRAITAAGRIRYNLVQKCRLGKNDEKQQRQITRMIIVVTAVFAFCNICPLVLNVWEAFEPRLFTDESDRTKRMVAYFMLDISNFLVVLNSSINFTIYIIYCRQYRRICSKYRQEIYGKRKRQPPMTDSDALVTECEIGYSTIGPTSRLILTRTRSISKL